MKNKTAKTFFRHLQLIALFSFFLSCTGDENTENVTIEGRWYHYQVSVNNGTFQNYNHITNCSKDYLEFLQNGIFKVVEHNDDGTCDENIQNGTWDLNSNSLLITINKVRVRCLSIINCFL